MVFRQLVIDLTVMLAAVLVVAALGPFGTYAIGDYSARVAYWFTALLTGYVFFRPTAILAPPLARRLAFPLVATFVGLSLVAAAPATLAIFVLNGGWRGWPSADDFLGSYPQVALIGLLVGSVFWVLARRRESRATGSVPAPTPARAPMQELVASAAPAPAAMPMEPDQPQPQPSPPQAAPRAPFIDRLPPHLGRDLIALEMEDHYVRAHTSAGSTLLLMRMRDAVAELAGVDGAQVHRSWWVARGAVEGAEVDGRQARLRLRGGLEAPVARNTLPALRERGWL